MRKDLKMGKGKMVSQGAHASMKVFLDRGTAWAGLLSIPLTDDMEWWVTNSFTKVTLAANSEEELVSLYQKALDANLPCAMIEDEGRTQFNGVETKTAIAIGPADADEIDKITGNLKLL